MALFDFDVDLLPVWAGALGATGATTISGELPYSTFVADDATRYDDAAEQRIVLMMEITRAYLETLTSRQQLLRFHHAMSRILGEVAYSRVYEDLGARTSSNVAVAGAAGTETVGVDVQAPDGSVVVVAPAAVGAAGDLATLVANINGLGGWPAEVEAYVDGNKLGFRLTAAGEAAGSTFLMTGDLVALVGVPVGPHTSGVREAARRARDKGLEHYHREIRAAAL